jgi:hypothetical protein
MKVLHARDVVFLEKYVFSKGSADVHTNTNNDQLYPKNLMTIFLVKKLMSLQRHHKLHWIVMNVQIQKKMKLQLMFREMIQVQDIHKVKVTRSNFLIMLSSKLAICLTENLPHSKEQWKKAMTEDLDSIQKNKVKEQYSVETVKVQSSRTKLA